MSNIIAELKQVAYTKDGKLNAAVLRQKWFRESNLCKKVIECTSFLDSDITFAARVYCIENNITAAPICPVTQMKLKWVPVKHRFAEVSGRGNACKVRNTKTSAWLDSIHKCKSTKKALFNTLFNQGDYKLKARDECIDFINMRLIETDYGRLHNFVDTQILREFHDICCSILSYTQHVLLDNSINWSERFYLLINNIEPKRCSNDPSLKARYSNFFIGYNTCSSRKNLQQKIYSNIQESIVSQDFTILNDINNHEIDEYQLMCNTCNNYLVRKLNNARWKDIFCAKCAGVTPGRSRAEQEIADFIRNECNLEVECSNKTILDGKEVDIFIPSKQLAIEYHGLLWHSYGSNYPNNEELENKKKYAHLEKTEECIRQGIHLLQIFENEWISKQSIVQSIIRSKLGLLQTKIFARRCKIEQVDSLAKKAFLEENHLQGNDNSQFAIALKYEGDIVAMMTFGRRQITKKVTFELIRFCCKLNTSVVGAASKLLKFFTINQQVESITTYADKRYCFDGSFYNSLGFKLIRSSELNYWWTDTKRVMHRANFQKHKLVEGGADASLTEREIMMKRGWRRIWDCGHFVFELTK